MKLFSFRFARRKAPADKKLANAIQNILGFVPGNIFLYHQAFLHRSASTESSNGLKINNERLEYLGDAILDAIAADFLFRKYPTRDEGFLTEMRSKMVSRVTLNKLCRKMGLDALITLDGTNNGAFRSSNGDAFEALIGAVYLDKGYKFTRDLFLNKVIHQYFDMDELVNQELNYKSRIIEWAQREKKTLHFQVVDEVGHGIHKLYVVEVQLDGIPLEKGQDHSIKGAEQLAAEKSWQKIITGTIDLRPENG